MKGPVKSFSEFRSQLHESRIEESKLGDMISKAKDAVVGALKKIGEFFTGAGSAFLNAVVNQSKGDIPKGVTIYPSKSDKAILQKNGVSVNVSEPVTENYIPRQLSEAKISLGGEQYGIKDLGTKDLIDRIEDNLIALQEGWVKDPSELNCLIWGAPGIGKTAIIKAIGSKYGFTQGNKRFIRVDLSSMESTDFTVPYVRHDSGQAEAGDAKKKWLPMYDTFNLSPEEGNAIANGPDGKGGILFFDEIARADESVQNVVMKLFDSDRGLNNWKLGDKWLCIAAANRKGDLADDATTFKWSPALGDRFPVQYNFVPTFEEWEKWAGEIDPDTGDVRVAEDILAFLSYAKDTWFHNFDPDKLGLNGEEYMMMVSPRSWKAASSQLQIAARTAKMRKVKFDDKQMVDIVSGAAGIDASKAFAQFLTVKRRFNPEVLKLIFTDPNKAPELWKEKSDVQFAAIAAATFLTQDKKLSDSELLNFMKYIGKFKDSVFAMYCIKALMRSHRDLEHNDFWTGDCYNLFFGVLYPELSADDL
jgi:hypothetical protein